MINTSSSARSMDVTLEFGPAFTTAHLKPGDSIEVEPGAMVSQSIGLDMKTGMSGKGGGLGGFLKSVAKSVLGGEVLLPEHVHSRFRWLDLDGPVIPRRHQDPGDRARIEHLHAGAFPSLLSECQL